MLKKELRQIFKRKRDNISYTDKLKWDDLILIQFQSIDFPYMDYILSFYPIEGNNETDTFLITDYLHFKNPNLHICYAKTDLRNKTMQAVLCGADTVFEANAYNIPEPVHNEITDPLKIDLIIVPMLAFDVKGNRVGYGKGFYDRYLTGCRKDCLKIGLSYFDPVESIDDTNEFDVPLDICITPQRIYVF